MIKHLRIQNFRSHKNTNLEFVKGVNCIVGLPEDIEKKICECGCGQEVKRKFVRGHGNKNKIMSNEQRKKLSFALKGKSKQFFIELNKNKPIHFCECGCGKIVKNKFILGHTNKGKILSKTTREKQSESRLEFYKNNIEARKKISARMSGDKNPSKSAETRKKISEKAKGRKKSEEQKKKISKSLIGFCHTKEAKLNMSIAQKNNWKNKDRIEKGRLAVIKNWENAEYRKNQIERMQGENHFNWQGGISRLPYAPNWSDILRESIRQRDKYRCQVCCADQENLNEKLHIHHIDYNKENCDPKNLISLCRSCHVKTNYQRNKWQSFFLGKERMKKVR